MTQPSPAAIGWRVHSGWAALVAVTGERKSVEVVHRQRVALADPAATGPTQPYHEAEGQPLAKARRIVERHDEEAQRRAGEALGPILDQLARRGYVVAASAVLASSGKPLPELESILASHALIHSADGELFRKAVQNASEKHGLRTTRPREKSLMSDAVASLHIPEEELKSLVRHLGKKIGPPWSEDQKLAALAAWVALLEPVKSSRSGKSEG